MKKFALVCLGLLLLAAPAALQAQFTWTTNNGAITITGYTGSGGDATIPATITGLPVSSIAPDAFFYSDVTSITISDGPTNIEEYAFSYCYGLTNITIPASVVNIGSYAFEDSYALATITVAAQNAFYGSVDGVLFNKSGTTLIQYPPAAPAGNYPIPGGVTSIGTDAFYDGVNLTNVTIPAGVTNIGDYAFYYTSLTNIVIPDSVTAIGLYTFSEDLLTNNLAIPGSVASIGYGAFSDNSLTSVTISNGVANLGPDAFAYNLLTNFTVPGSVTNIGSDILAGNSVTSITISNGVTSIEVAAFESLTTLTNVTLPDSLTTIGDAAFQECPLLTQITIPPNVTNIVYGAFEYDGLTSVTISGDNTAIGSYVFNYCTNLTSVTISGNGTSIGDDAFNDCTSLADVIIANGVTSIGEDAFAYCPLTSIGIPDSVTNIGSPGASAFSYCTRLTAITVAAQNTSYSSINGVLFNSDQTALVEYPEGLAGNYTIPNSVTSIGEQAFEGCSGLTGIAISGSVTNIGDDPFGDCTSLPAITVAPQNLFYSSTNGVLFNENQTTLIQFPGGRGGNYAIPGSVTDIGDEAFDSCTNLITVTIPASVTTLGFEPFIDCTSLTGLYFLGDAPTGGGTEPDGDNNATAYYLPGTTGWSFSIASLPAVALTAIPITANPTNGGIPLTVSFTSAAADGAGNPVTNRTWNFGDGSSSIVQNPSHTYPGIGVFPVTLLETNDHGLPIAGAGVTITTTNPPVYSGLVLNGGFETGDFTGWYGFGDLSYTFVDDGYYSGITPYAGNYEALLGTSSSLGYLYQTLSTTPGTSYLLSFWFNNSDQDPGQFSVSWNGNTLLDTSNPVADNWTNIQFVVTATSTSTVLEFGFEDNIYYFALDDISVVPLQPGIAGLSLSGANLVLNGINGQSGGTYHVLTSTSLALPFSQWTPVTTNILTANGNFTLTLTNSVSPNLPQRFYILQQQ